jgi:hypothetical protein
MLHTTRLSNDLIPYASENCLHLIIHSVSEECQELVNLGCSVTFWTKRILKHTDVKTSKSVHLYFIKNNLPWFYAFCGYFIFSLLVFHKFLEADMHLMLKMDFHVCDSNVHGSFIQTIPFDERHIY